MKADGTLSGTTLPLEDFKAIVATLRPAAVEAANEIWNDAAITGSFSFSSGGANLEGWISYYDGTKVYFQLTGFSAKTGTAAGTFALPLIRVKPAATFVGTPGTCELSGFWVAGSLVLGNSQGPITQTAIAMISVAPWDYHLAGSVRYSQA